MEMSTVISYGVKIILYIPGARISLLLKRMTHWARFRYDKYFEGERDLIIHGIIQHSSLYGLMKAKQKYI